MASKRAARVIGFLDLGLQEGHSGIHVAAQLAARVTQGNECRALAVNGLHMGATTCLTNYPNGNQPAIIVCQNHVSLIS